MATKGTLNSGLFEKTSQKLDKEIKIVEQIGTGLVALIENGKLDSEEMTQLLQHYLMPMVSENIDCLVLGCTHYPYLIPQIRKIIGPKIHIIDSGQAVAKQTKKVLSEAGLLKTIQTKNKRSHQFLINRDKNTLTELLADCEKEKSLILLETDF